jgi:endogenous inhibitor of DNA gyrase (YacG/DUF329 family)
MAQFKPGPSHAPIGSCPICRAPTALEFRPFCSGRCADVDLSRWLRGAYAIAGGDDDDDEDGDDARATRGVSTAPRALKDEQD